jgi:hypothetical protein
MNEDGTTGGHLAGLKQTLRTDRWWIEPLWTGLGFLCFVIYSNWAAFQGEHYWHEAYLSPFYSPVLYVDQFREGSAPLVHAWLGVWPQWLHDIWPKFGSYTLPTSPSWLILAGPLSFRATCYYYRKFYYRAYFMTPPACSVGALRQKNYKGETFLFVLQNVHRFTWFIAAAYIVILTWDAFVGMWQGGAVFEGQFGIGVGTIVLYANAALLACYTFGCHSFRHMIGGSIDCNSCSANTRARYGLWKKATSLNENHMKWAWISMVWVGLTDLYIRLCSMGILVDLNTWN